MPRPLIQHRRVCLLVLSALLGPAVAAAAGGEAETTRRVEFFVLWGASGEWNGRLTLDHGRFAHVEPYLFTDEKDRILHSDDREVSWRSETRGDVDGLQVVADIATESSLRFSSERTTQTIAVKEVPDTGYRVVYLDNKKDYLIVGKGSPVKGPRPKHDVPALGIPALPDPQKIAALPADLTEKDTVHIELSQRPAGALAARRRPAGDGRLVLEVYSPSGSLHGTAHVSTRGSEFDTAAVGGSLWFSLKPRIGTIALQIAGKDNLEPQQITIPTTLVEVRGPRLFVNGEPFLIKGTLPRGLDDKDARFIKGLGVNTIRGLNMEAADRYGFMLIASMNSGVGKIVPAKMSPTEKAFEENVRQYVEQVASRAREAARSPHTLVIQLGNEQTDHGDPWSESLKPVNTFARLDLLLTRLWTAVKPIDPMLPLGYANHARGYIAPDFLDVYMHNSYMDKDRYGVPLRTFMHWQGCEKRSFINSEFGANRYTPQAYHGAKASPVLEKIHAWNFPHRWKEYMDAGTAGAVNYCFYDLEGPWDQGTSNFGLMTFDRKPKLACWEVGHMWRDFEVSPSTAAPDQTSGQSLSIAYKRDYRAQNCTLRVTSDHGDKTIALEDFSPSSRRVIQVPVQADSFHWEINYTTHGGLAQMATGAYPPSIEEEDFLRLLKTRETFPFLSKLFDAEVVTVEGQTAPPTLTDMQRPDGVVPVAFRKRDGTVYVTAFARLPIKNDLYVKADIPTAFKGKVVQVDEWTGEPTGATIECETDAHGVRIRNVNVPRIPGAIGQRSEKPLSLPVFRITAASVPGSKP